MGQCSSDNFKRIFRCSKCETHERRKQRQSVKKPSESPQIDQQILTAFFNLADDPIYISQRAFVENLGLGHALGQSLWQYLQGDDKKTMDLRQFLRHGIILKGMQLNNYAKMGMNPNKLLHACLESCQIGIGESEKDIEFLQKLSKQMGNNPDEIIAWKERNCPRLFQSIHENVLNKFLGMPKSIIEESKLEDSELLSPVQMFFLKHNLPRNVFFEKNEEENEENVQKNKGWTKLYESKKQGLGAVNFEENVFPFDGSTISIFRMLNAQLLVLAVDEQFKNSNHPFGGPYTILFEFEPEFQRMEKDPPAIHCNFKNWANSLFFNGGSILALKNDFSNVKDIEVWGCARREATEFKMPKIGEEERKILEKRKPNKEGNEIGGKARRKRENAVEQWNENPDKQLLEMAGFAFSENQRGKATRK